MFSIPFSHLFFEISTYILFIICFRHAAKQKVRRNERMAILISGTFYGILLETMTIYQLHAYKYGAFLVMFHGEIPLTIGIGWGIILYSAIIIADSLKLSFAAWVAAVGLLGLGIDTTMDVMAVRTGMWRWFAIDSFDGRFLAQDQDWFGVTFGNYYAWFIVLISAAAFIRLYNLNSASNIFILVLKCIAVIGSSVIVLGVLDQIYVSYVNHKWWPVLLEIFSAVFVIIYSSLRRDGQHRDKSAFSGMPAYVVPFFFHVYFTDLMILAVFQPSIIYDSEMKELFLSQLPALLCISLALLAATVYIHVTTYKKMHLLKNIYSETITD